VERMDLTVDRDLMSKVTFPVAHATRLSITGDLGGVQPVS